ncbi:hypothetical protein [Ammoniphilus sp. CFH 90114]|uniref:hypothetical protein n=1 Tax=Ammoniphilus sp. CFH 90114 TaxID=2493665 RepID=UPI00100FF79A|nr:hypothetical protein [Ammoniphilus sp. CFH 90114]RXT01920.1 hypothetical protein EIZ39_25335 [Ammoniphilus sp. CFH 90114]
MKLSKKKMTVLSFALGASVFVSTAFADMMLGSGYDRLKDSAKTTAAQMEKGLNNYTIEALFTLKDNDHTLMQASTFNKMDTQKQASENSTVTQYANGESTSNYSYSDKQVSIWKSGIENKYYVTEFPEDMDRENWSKFSNPFNEKGAPEIEKIVDALVGNLKDYVQAEDRPEGGRIYSGSLSATQVPAIVNAVSSFGVKQMMRDQAHMEGKMEFAEIESDIHVKKVTGTAIENKEGFLENVTGDIMLSGVDKNGVQHDLTLNVVFKLSDVGTTKITKPDLDGANVEKVSHFGGLTSKHVGTYKNDIVVEKDGKFVKIGERVIEITSVDGGKVSGAYSENVKPGFETDHPDSYQFKFEYKQNDYNPKFTYTNPKGEQETGSIHLSNPGKLYLDLQIEMIDKDSWRSNTRPNFDQQFNRVFEE